MPFVIPTRLIYAFAVLNAFATLFLTSIITTKCDSHQKWFAVIFVPLIVGFVSSFYLGRASDSNEGITLNATIVVLSIMMFIFLEVSAIFRMHPDNRIFLIALSAMTIQGQYIAYRSGVASSRVTT